MSTALLRAVIEEVRVEFNGDTDDSELRAELDRRRGKIQKRIQKKRQRLAQAQSKKNLNVEAEIETQLEELKEKLKGVAAPKDNSVVSSLFYPRSGSSQQVTMRSFDLPSGTTVQPNVNDFLKSGLIKEEIQGETRLQIAVTDKDPRNRILNFLRAVASSLFGSLAKGVIDGISETVVSASASELSSVLGTRIKGSGKEKETVIAKSKSVDLRIRQGGALEVTNADGKDIVFDKGSLTLTLRAPKKLTIEAPEAGKAGKSIARNGLNGHIKLRLTTDSP